MKLVVDENIPFAKHVFGSFGSVVLCQGRDINSEVIRDADALIIRSVTKVNEQLLANSKLGFIGSCTVGKDHIDEQLLQNKEISYAFAPGSNSRSAAEYTLTAILAVAAEKNIAAEDLQIVLVGGGHVGQKVYQLCTTLGATVSICDPLLSQAQQDSQANYISWQQVLTSDADILSLHVPLTHHGEHPTHQLLNKDSLAALNPKTAIINNSRGGVIAEHDLLEDIKTSKRLLVLDVWNNEPDINFQMLKQCFIATAHIAGYSLDGKLEGANMIYRALCKHVDRMDNWQQFAINLPQPEPISGDYTDWLSLCSQAYDIFKDDSLLRASYLKGGTTYFDDLRKNYRPRRDFAAFSVSCNQILPESKIKGIGFEISGC